MSVSDRSLPGDQARAGSSRRPHDGRVVRRKRDRQLPRRYTGKPARRLGDSAVLVSGRKLGRRGPIAAVDLAFAGAPDARKNVAASLIGDAMKKTLLLAAAVLGTAITAGANAQPDESVVTKSDSQQAAQPTNNSTKQGIKNDAASAKQGIKRSASEVK